MIYWILLAVFGWVAVWVAILVSARTSRAAYGIGKALAFSLVILLVTPGVLAPIVLEARRLI